MTATSASERERAARLAAARAAGERLRARSRELAARPVEAPSSGLAGCSECRAARGVLKRAGSNATPRYSCAQCDPRPKLPASVRLSDRVSDSLPCWPSSSRAYRW